MHKCAAGLFSLVVTTCVFGQVIETDTLPPPPTASPAQANLKIISHTTTTVGRIPRYSSSTEISGLTDSVLLEEGGALKVFGDMYAFNRFYLAYPASGGGADLTGMAGTAQMLSVGFNNTAAFSGATGQDSGRMLYFYDRVAPGAYRGVLDGAGTWWFGSSPTNYGLRVLAPTSGVVGMTIDAAGNVAIGVGAGQAGKKFYVEGDSFFHGEVRGTKIRAQYQDVAEWVSSSDDLEPGTVVILDKRAGNTVTASRKAYDTMVAGVVSAEPGILLGEGSATKEQIATTGRVRIRADASQHAIEIGDLLVTSNVAGTAMKSAPIDIGGVAIHRPGTIIGKALEPLDHGVGEILVLLSLQ